MQNTDRKSREIKILCVLNREEQRKLVKNVGMIANVEWHREKKKTR